MIIPHFLSMTPHPHISFANAGNRLWQCRTGL
jgi:hypothetical protein